MKPILISFVFIILLSECRVFAFEDTEPDYHIQSINIQGNQKTKREIILRELTFHIDDTLSESELKNQIKQSQENIYNLLIFNRVTLNYNIDSITPKTININIEVIERWYIIPAVVIQIGHGNVNTWLAQPEWNTLTYGIYLTFYNFRGRNERLRFIGRAGYNYEARIIYDMPTINKNQNFGISFDINYILNKKLAYKYVDYKQEYLHSQSKPLRQGTNIAVKIMFRAKHKVSQELKLGYTFFQYSDTVFKYNPDFALKKNTHYLTLFAKFKFDFRDYHPYPLEGFYADIILEKQGFFLPFEGVDHFVIQANGRFYYPIAKRWFLATSINILNSIGTPIFDVQNCVGYQRDEFRSLENWLIPAHFFAINRNQIKFAILPQKHINLKFIKNKKYAAFKYGLYTNLFLDCGYIDYDHYNTEFYKITKWNNFIWAFGLGLDFITFYDKVIRLEGSYNPTYNKWAFSVNFTAPI